MNNLHRELAPVSEGAWAGIEEEATRTFTLHLAGRRVAQVQGPGGATLAAVGTGHLADVSAPIDGVTARVRQVQPLVELRVPFSLSRQAIDDVERRAPSPPPRTGSSSPATRPGTSRASRPAGRTSGPGHCPPTRASTRTPSARP